ncbi:MAG TPA: DUF1772 domain-containing protein [Terriglobales bacterium]|nr:DUF1772 domain-containing protein [Terriglobales bacterium]
MFAFVINFADLVLAALLVGAVFGAWLFLNPQGLNANSYITLQQQAIRTMNIVMPALGAATTLVTITATVLGRGDRGQLCLLAGAAACFVTLGLITRFLNQPINEIVMTWRVDLPPPNWTVLRDDWWKWHHVRLVTGLVGLCLLIAATLKRG